MKFDRKEIKKLALSNMQYSTYEPLEAVIMAIETWMGKNKLVFSKLTKHEQIKAIQYVNDSVVDEIKATDKGQGEA